jgi:membrane protease YdiL (CAAX protease family)
MIIATPERSSLYSSFTLRFATALAAGLVAAVTIAPFAATAISAMGFRLPFPRIFDRTVMVTLLAAMLIWSRPMSFARLMHDGFAAPRPKFLGAAAGLAIALVAIAALFALALASGSGGAVTIGALVARAARFVVPAILIGVIEEGFFRAFLLGGIRHDFGPRAALAISSAIYAVAHLVRSPKHYYLTGFNANAGLNDLGASAAQLGHPIVAAPMLIGLFLLGMVLGEAFILSGTVWFSIGLHAGFVIGAKTWPLIARGGVPVSGWISGGGPVPLIAAPAAWLIALALLLILPQFLGADRTDHGERRHFFFG